MRKGRLKSPFVAYYLFFNDLKNIPKPQSITNKEIINPTKGIKPIRERITVIAATSIIPFTLLNFLFLIKFAIDIIKIGFAIINISIYNIASNKPTKAPIRVISSNITKIGTNISIPRPIPIEENILEKDSLSIYLGINLVINRYIKIT